MTYQKPPDLSKTETELMPSHGVLFWKMAIFEGSSSVFVAMSGAIMAAGATWDSATFDKMEWWQWGLFWLGVTTAGVKTLQAFLSKTVSLLTARAKQEDEELSPRSAYPDLR